MIIIMVGIHQSLFTGAWVPSCCFSGSLGSQKLGRPEALRMKLLIYSTTVKCGHNQPQYNRPQRQATNKNEITTVSMGAST